MSANDGHIARLWAEIVGRCVLLNRYFQLLILVLCSRSRILSDMRRGKSMFFYPEQGHFQCEDGRAAVIACFLGPGLRQWVPRGAMKQTQKVRPYTLLFECKGECIVLD